MIGLNCISQISETCQSRTCGFLSSRNPEGWGMGFGGGFPGSLAMVNLLAWSKVFHVKFHLDLMDSEHGHVGNQSGSLFTCLLV